MTTHGKDGDLTVITDDIFSCAANIGCVARLNVSVSRGQNGRLTWLVDPIIDQPHIINNSAGDFSRLMGFEDVGIEHPNEWQIPDSPRLQYNNIEERKGQFVEIK
jgi:hypothetical protein